MSVSYVVAEDTYETKSVCVWVICCVFGQIPAGHPIRYKLKGIGSGTQKGNDVWVR